ncbi:hypothetical protein HBF24_08995 [Oleiagrimonas sp. C23AA]|nr:hypothetical protein [Oleiagrimonas sp. C23AA]
MQPLLASGTLVEFFPDWPDEIFPLYAIYPSRRHPPAKVRAFLDFCLQITRDLPRGRPVAKPKSRIRPRVSGSSTK